MEPRAIVAGWLYPLAAAFQFLSRFPVPVQVPFEERVLQRSVVFYPLAGFVIGAVLGAGVAFLPLALPPSAAAAILTAIWAYLTGGLHLDGLMDTADGVMSHRSRERMLEIMKDSHTGAMGVMACVLQLLMKYGLLYALMASIPDFGRLQAAVLLTLTPLWSRWMMTAAMCMWPYAGGSGGLGAMFRGTGSRHLAGSTVMALLLAIPAGVRLSGGFGPGLTVTAAAIVWTALGGGGLAFRLSKKLGGLTGDTYGAINECTETWLLLAVVWYVSSGIFG